MSTKRVIAYVALVWLVIGVTASYYVGQFLGYNVIMALWAK